MEEVGGFVLENGYGADHLKIYRRLCTICMSSYVCVCMEGRLDPFHFYPHPILFPFLSV